MLKLEHVVTAGSSKNRTTERAAPHSHLEPNLAWLGRILHRKFSCVRQESFTYRSSSSSNGIQSQSLNSIGGNKIIMSMRKDVTTFQPQSEVEITMMQMVLLYV